MGLIVRVDVSCAGQDAAQHTFDSEDNRTIKIGRLSSAQLRLDDPKASRIHAVLELSAQGASLTDMGSSEGTLVNGGKVHKVELGTGDRIQIGDTELVVTVGDQVAAAVAPSEADTQPVADTDSTQVTAAPAMPTTVGNTEVATPRFDPGVSAEIPIRRITKEQLRVAAVQSGNAGADPEEAMTDHNRVLEMRLYWGETLLDMHHYDKPKSITVGENKSTDIFLSSEGLPVEEFPLIRFVDGDYVLTFTSQMEGEVEVDGELRSLRDIQSTEHVRRDDALDDSYRVTMAPNTRAIVHWGGATFALRFVAPAHKIPFPFMKNLDLHYVNMLLLSMFLHVMSVGGLMIFPHDMEALREDLFDTDDQDRWSEIILTQPQESKATAKLLDRIKKIKKREVDKLPPEAHVDRLNISNSRNAHTKSKAQKKAEVQEAIAQAFSGLGGGGSGGHGDGNGSLLGGGGGGSLSGSLNNVIGTAGKGSASSGLFGMGIRGKGPLTGGGIGTSRGVGGLGTAGRLGGGSGGGGYGLGAGGLGGRRERGVISLSTPIVMGALPKEVIQKVINENKAQIRYCYERGLQKNQDLSGKVRLKWIISGTGSVAKVNVTETTLNNRGVETCIKQKVKGWRFPAPAGGGIVEVNYPFVLKAS